MNIGLISVRYAKALYLFAQKVNKENEIYEQADFLLQVFSNIKSLNTSLSNPLIPKARKKEIIYTASGENLSDEFKKFIDLLLKNNREECLQSIMVQYKELYRQDKKILHGKLITAVEVDKTTKNHLIQTIENKVEGKIELEEIVDESILGGFILELDFLRWNASLKNQLNKIKNQYIERNRRII